MEGAIIAAIGALPPTIMALLAWRSAHGAQNAATDTHDEVRTNHGKRAGEYLERLADDMLHLKSIIITKNEFEAHVNDPTAHERGRFN